MNQLLTTFISIDYLNLSRSTLRQQRMKQRRPSGMPVIPFLRFGRNIRYDVRQLDELIESLRVVNG
jgi:hypothetical protein